MDTRQRIERFDRMIRHRNLREMIVGLLLLPVFAAAALGAPPGSRIRYGHLLILVGIVVVIGMLRFAAWPRVNLVTHPSTDPEPWRAEIRRQARLLRLAAFWYIGPFLPGLAILAWDMSSTSLAWVPVVVVAAILGGVILLNWVAARELDREADALASPAAETTR